MEWSIYVDTEKGFSYKLGKGTVSKQIRRALAVQKLIYILLLHPYVINILLHCTVTYIHLQPTHVARSVYYNDYVAGLTLYLT